MIAILTSNPVIISVILTLESLKGGWLASLEAKYKWLFNSQ